MLSDPEKEIKRLREWLNTIDGVAQMHARGEPDGIGRGPSFENISGFAVMDGLRQLADKNWMHDVPGHPFEGKPNVSWECRHCNRPRGYHVEREEPA